MKLSQVSAGQSTMPLMASDFNEMWLDDANNVRLVTVRGGTRIVRIVREWRECVQVEPIEIPKKKP